MRRTVKLIPMSIIILMSLTSAISLVYAHSSVEGIIIQDITKTEDELSIIIQNGLIGAYGLIGTHRLIDGPITQRARA